MHVARRCSDGKTVDEECAVPCGMSGIEAAAWPEIFRGATATDALQIVRSYILQH